MKQPLDRLSHFCYNTHIFMKGEQVMNTPSVAQVLREKEQSAKVIARLTGVPSGTVKKWLVGDNIPQPKVHRKLCNALNIRYSRFLRSYDADKARRKERRKGGGVVEIPQTVTTNVQKVSKDAMLKRLVEIATTVTKLDGKERESLDLLVQAMDLTKQDA